MNKEFVIKGCINGEIKLMILNINTLAKIKHLILILNSMNYSLNGNEELRIENSHFLKSKNLCYALNWFDKFSIGYAEDTYIPKSYEGIDCVEFISYFDSDVKAFLKNW